MKKQNLKQLIQECVKDVLNEGFLTEANNDPTKDEMLQFLRTQFGNEEGFADDAEVAMYWFANFNHSGQWSNLYSVLSTSAFNPGPLARGPEPNSAEEMMYQALESEYGSSENNEVDEMSGVGGAGAPGTGAGNVTANVDPVRTPRAFKKKVQEAEDPKDAFQVEYVGPYGNEQPFMMQTPDGKAKFEYCMGKYPDGTEDIAVYAYRGDITYGYKAFRKMFNIQEEEQPEMYDDETDAMAPGPRQRPEDWESPEIPPVQHTKLSELIKPRTPKI